LTSFAPSFFEGLADRLSLATYDTNAELRERRLTKLLHEAEMVRRRLIEPAVIDGQMRPAGYEFEDDSAGPHRRNDAGGFAYHKQFVDIPAMSVVDRIKSKAVQANGVVGRVVKKVEAGLDDIIGREEGLLKHAETAFAPHLSALSETRDTLDGVQSALDVMTNGGPSLDPLPVSGDAPKT
jgi:hypothetical protein